MNIKVNLDIEELRVLINIEICVKAKFQQFEKLLKQEKKTLDIKNYLYI